MHTHEQAFNRRAWTWLGLGRAGNATSPINLDVYGHHSIYVAFLQFFEAGLIKALVLFLRLLVLPLKVLGTFVLRFKDIVP